MFGHQIRAADALGKAGEVLDSVIVVSEPPSKIAPPKVSGLTAARAV
jgi:hypothetical protein